MTDVEEAAQQSNKPHIPCKPPTSRCKQSALVSGTRSQSELFSGILWARKRRLSQQVGTSISEDFLSYVRYLEIASSSYQDPSRTTQVMLDVVMESDHAIPFLSQSEVFRYDI